MSAGYCDLKGSRTESADLTLARAASVAAALANMEYCSPVECISAANGSECVVFDTQVQVGQERRCDIRRTERIALSFDPKDRFRPEVWALRVDFPTGIHTNIRDYDHPVSLCTTEEPWEEERRHWTATECVEGIRRWLSRAARGELHEADQPLEPLILTHAGYLVLPECSYDVLDGGTVGIELRSTLNGKMGLVAGPVPEDVRSAERSFLGLHIRTRPRQHGRISRSPKVLSDLVGMLSEPGWDFADVLRKKLLSAHQKDPNPDLMALRPILIISVPATREKGGPVEREETWAFACLANVAEVGESLDAWLLIDGSPGHVMSPSRKGENCGVDVLLPLEPFSQEAAAVLSGAAAVRAPVVTAVGLGAIGSQVFMNLTRMGVGSWYLVDKDMLLPHNLAKHALFESCVGHAKTDALSAMANQILGSDTFSKSLCCDVLDPGELRQDLEAAYKNSAAILDFSTSIAVARHLCRDVASKGRRISCFMNPAGTDLVVLAEDSARTVPLDSLEMQYYRAVLNDDRLSNHLGSSGKTQRYARSCRDVTNTIPQYSFAALSGICSREIGALVANDTAALFVWQQHEHKIVRVEFAPHQPCVTTVESWEVVADPGFLEARSQNRLERLPNETGGVLLGAYDMARKIVYVVDAIASPPDSDEWPGAYIRGCEDLASRVEDATVRTAGNVTYIGEWHSHPDGSPCEMSPDDEEHFSWQRQTMHASQLPALMLIVGQNGTHRFFLSPAT